MPPAWRETARKALTRITRTSKRSLSRKYKEHEIRVAQESRAENSVMKRTKIRLPIVSPRLALQPVSVCCLRNQSWSVELRLFVLFREKDGRGENRVVELVQLGQVADPGGR